MIQPFSLRRKITIDRGIVWFTTRKKTIKHSMVQQSCVIARPIVKDRQPCLEIESRCYLLYRVNYHNSTRLTCFFCLSQFLFELFLVTFGTIFFINVPYPQKKQSRAFDILIGLTNVTILSHFNEMEHGCELVGFEFFYHCNICFFFWDHCNIC
jgi:hypothetical protein